MKKTIVLSALVLVLAMGTGLGFAQMMGGGQHMYGGQGAEAGQQKAPPENPSEAYPPMTGYGYGMGPGMMGGYGYGMGPGMMGYGGGMYPGMMGYGMGPGMMGYGGGMYPGMMGGYGYGMGPGMMGYGMGPGMMGGCGGWYPGPTGENVEKYNKALDETRELRRKLHSMQFDYGEALRNPGISDEKRKEMAEELFDLREKIRQKMHE